MVHRANPLVNNLLLHGKVKKCLTFYTSKWLKEQRIFCKTWKLCEIQNFSLHKLMHICAHMTVFPWQSWVVAKETISPVKPKIILKYLLSGPRKSMSTHGQAQTMITILVFCSGSKQCWSELEAVEDNLLSKLYYLPKWNLVSKVWRLENKDRVLLIWS
jgi:hypothetical protein